MKVCIIGMGLIGGSLGLSLRKNQPHIFVRGIVRKKQDIRKVLNKGAADEASTDLIKGALDSDWIILATPPNSFESILKKLSPYLRSSQIVTDVGSVKKSVVGIYKKILRNRVPYIGSHPIAGSERKGLDAAQHNLFDGAICVLTPDNNTSANTLKKAKAFWKMLKVVPVVKSAEQHDKIFAYVSHLPHLISFAMVHAISNKDYLRVAGEAWRDMTRVAHSSSELWTEIFMLNRSYIMKSLKRFFTELEIVKKKLTLLDSYSLKKYLDQTKSLLKNEYKNKLQK